MNRLDHKRLLDKQKGKQDLTEEEFNRIFKPKTMMPWFAEELAKKAYYNDITERIRQLKTINKS